MAEKIKEKSLADELGNEGVFDEFYLGYLRSFEKKIEDIFENTKLKVEDRQEMKKTLLFFMKEALVDISISTLIHDLHEKQKNGTFLYKDSREGYEKYCAYLLEKGTQDILVQYPVMKQLLETKLYTTETMLLEIMTNLEKDRMLLEKEFEVNTSVLKNIELGKGDTHNHGRMVAVITFACGEKVVYKPRSLKPELAFAHMCEWLNQYDTSHKLKCAKAIDRGTFGWQEFIARKECREEGEVKAYFRRMGKNMALFYVLNTSDLHGENILPCGEYPYFVDLETLLTAQKRIPREKDSSEKSELSYEVQNRIAHSVFSTSILPPAFALKVLDVDISGLGARPGQESKKLKYLKLYDKGTAEIHFEEEAYVTGELDNSVILCGEKVDYIRYVEEIEKGFAGTYRILLEKKEELEYEINKKFSNGFYRQVLRGTYVYCRFLSASKHPNYLVSQKEYEKLLCLINSNQTLRGREEVRQMMENDVPYFMADYNSTTLYTSGFVVEHNFFERSLKEQISGNISRLGENDLIQQLSFIRNGIMLSKNDIMVEEKGISKKERLGKCTSNANPQRTLKTIAERISNYAIWDQEHTSCIFMEPNLGEKTVMGVISDTLYHYIGTVWFLFAYAAYTQRGEDIQFAKAALNGLESIYPQKNYIKSTAAFSGYFSYIYLYVNLHELTGDIVYREKYQNLLKQISEYDPQQEPLIDIMAGLSGAVLILAHMEEKESTEMSRELLQKYANILNRRVDEQKDILTGFSHGMAGMALALRTAGAVLGEKKYELKAEKLQSQEDGFFSEKDDNWLDLRENKEHCEMFWCHGAPGILLGRSYQKNAKEKFSDYNDIIRNIEASVEEGQMNDSMCHGTIGNLDLLLTIARNTENNKLKNNLAKLYQKLAERISENGVEYGIPQMRGLVSFMLGLSGIGYGLLRYLNPSLPCILSLEIYGGKKDGRLSA